MKLFNLKTNLVLLSMAALLQVSCSSSKPAATTNYKPVLYDEYSFALTAVATDKSYGYTQRNPIKVGGSKDSEGPRNEQRFLNSIAGPNGEAITYNRTGSCCQFKSDNGLMGVGLLDIYVVRWEGQQEPITLYINMYDAAELHAPTGMTIKQR